MFFRKKAKTGIELGKEMLAKIEKQKKEKEITLTSLCGDAFQTGKSGLVTAITGGLLFPFSATAFGIGVYCLYERVYDGFVLENPSRLNDDAVLLIAEMGATAILSAWGTKYLAKWTMEDYNTLKTHYLEYAGKIGNNKA